MAAIARMEPKEAAAILTQVMSKTNDPAGYIKGPLARSLSAVVARMEPKEAAAALVPRLEQCQRAAYIAGPRPRSIGGGAAWSRRRPSYCPGRRCLPRRVDEHDHHIGCRSGSCSRPGNGGGPHGAKEATRVCGLAAAILTETMNKTPIVAWLLSLSEGVLALVEAWSRKRAASYLDRPAAAHIKGHQHGVWERLTESLRKSVVLVGAHATKEAAATLSQAMQAFTPQQVQFFSIDRVQLRLICCRRVCQRWQRMEPKEAAEAAAALSQAMSKTTDPRSMSGLSQGLSVVAARMDPKEAALV